MSLKEDHLIIFMCYPEPNLSEEQLTWAQRHVPEQNIIKFPNHPNDMGLDVIQAWNRAVQRHVLTAPDSIKWIIWCQDDAFPDERSDPLFTAPESLCCCAYDDPIKPTLFFQTHAFHSALCRVDREVFELVEGRWWDWERHPDTGDPVGCQCIGMKRKAFAYGFESGIPRGKVDHRCLRRPGTQVDEHQKPGPPAYMSLSMWNEIRAGQEKKRAKRRAEIRG